jgi:phosphotransacetylase
MCLDDRVSVFWNCAINPNPSAEEEQRLPYHQLIRAWHYELKIAMLSILQELQEKVISIGEESYPNCSRKKRLI